MRIEEYVQDAFVSIMEARAGVIALGVEVRRYKDFEELKGNQHILVRVVPGRKLANNYYYYELVVDLMAMSKRDEDLTGQKLDDLYDQCEEELYETVTVLSLQTAIDNLYPDSKITIDGIVPDQGEEIGEVIYGLVASARVYLSYNKPTT